MCERDSWWSSLLCDDLEEKDGGSGREGRYIYTYTLGAGLHRCTAGDDATYKAFILQLKNKKATLPNTLNVIPCCLSKQKNYLWTDTTEH